MAKKLVSVRLSDEAIAILKRLAEEQDRSEAYIIEKLLEGTQPKKVAKKASQPSR